MTVAISVEAVSKSFRIPLDKAATLKYRATHPRSSSRYRHFSALNNVSFEVADGEFLGIIGHNGSGKSTLLKILAGIYMPTSGRVSVNGRVSPFLELGVGFNPELNARENVFLSGAVLGLTRSELNERVDDIIAFAGIEEFAQTKLKNFSSGMQVRLAFSVAIQADARILLMDEVLAVGDAAFAQKCFDVFAQYKREGRTIVLVTHDLAAVHNYCDRCLLLDHGRLLADGPAAETTAMYRRMVAATTEHADDGVVQAADGMPAEVSRWGSREVTVTGVRLLDGSGKQHTSFSTGSPMTIEVEYLVNDDSAGAFICGLAFERSDGLNIAGPNTGDAALPIACPPPGSHGVIRYHVDRLPLLGAAYMLTAALYDRHGTHAFDHIERVLQFRVVDEVGRQGLVDLSGQWEIPPATTPDQVETPLHIAHG